MASPIFSDFDLCQISFCNLASPRKEQMPPRLKNHDEIFFIVLIWKMERYWGLIPPWNKPFRKVDCQFKFH